MGISGVAFGLRANLWFNRGVNTTDNASNPTATAGDIVLTFVVPSYNVEDYLGRCLSSLLIEQDLSDTEILIVNDGSKDGTAALAREYEKRYPNVIRVIDQENKGHGGAVNTGVANARGMYVKVVDADDWLDMVALRNVLAELRTQARAEAPVDLLITNYTYEKQGKRIKQTIRYRGVLPVNRILGWNDVKRFRPDQNLLMHSLIYRTKVLREKARLALPEHTFYVDNIYAYAPLPQVRTLMYMDEDLYRYFIGREGQSVEKDTMIRRIDQLIRVVQTMIDATPSPDAVPAGLYRYMIHYLTINMAVDSVFMVLSKDKENYRRKDELWAYLAEHAPEANEAVRRTMIGRLLNVPGPLGRMLVHVGYGIAHNVFGVN
ncbi:glycosyl transferase [Bifidobacterium vansinderenii]|uniref:Glycosyl transferase n=1 Tax=Bifidobacterium vansinderenii TaxID=1984871 RepID=A0A229VVR6_9BIFI|nr:glycosyl transferase [Bifidobacterium vansinderenii]